MVGKGKPGPNKRFTARLRDIRISEKVRSALETMARRQGLTTSDIVREAIDETLHNFDPALLNDVGEPNAFLEAYHSDLASQETAVATPRLEDWPTPEGTIATQDILASVSGVNFRLGKNGLITALDIGSTKVCCFIARADGSGGVRVIGIGHQIARGMRAGTVVDMDAAEEAVRGAVVAAERMANERVDSVLLSFSGGQPASRLIDVETDIAGLEIGERDLKRALAQANLLARRSTEGQEILNTNPAGYSVDGEPCYLEPRGMFGDRLGLRLHVISAAVGPLRNLKLLAERCHLEIAALVLAPYASGLSTLDEVEMDLGVTLIDMGGGSTDFAVFYDGHMIYTDQVPVGGNHVTNDIARGLSTTASYAERLKTLHGSAVAGPDDEHAMVSVPRVGESGADAVQQIPRSMLIGIIQPRIEETLELIRGRLQASGLAQTAGRHAVLTGGGSLLTGVREHAQRILDKEVRVGRSLGVRGLTEATEGPAFASAAGLLTYAERELWRQTRLRSWSETNQLEAGGGDP